MERIQRRKVIKIAAIHAAILIFIIVYSRFIGCPFRHFFGIPCPGCGLTRAYMAFFAGHIRAAFAYHPLFLFALPLLFFFLHIPVFHFPVSERLQNGIAIAAIGLFIGVYLVRIFVLHDPVLQVDFHYSAFGRLF